MVSARTDLIDTMAGSCRDHQGWLAAAGYPPAAVPPGYARGTVGTTAPRPGITRVAAAHPEKRAVVSRGRMTFASSMAHRTVIAAGVHGHGPEAGATRYCPAPKPGHSSWPGRRAEGRPDPGGILGAQRRHEISRSDARTRRRPRPPGGGRSAGFDWSPSPARIRARLPHCPKSCTAGARPAAGDRRRIWGGTLDPPGPPGRRDDPGSRSRRTWPCSSS